MMKTYSKLIIGILFMAIVSCDMTTSTQSQNVIASDKSVQFEVFKSESYNLIMTSLVGDSTILSISDLDCRPIDFFKDGPRYFFTCIGHNNQKTIWEIEEDLGRIIQLDLQENDLDDLEKLK